GAGAWVNDRGRRVLGGARAHRRVPTAGHRKDALRAPGDRLLPRLLLSSAARQRSRAWLHADRCHRSYQHRLPVRALAVRDGLAPRLVLHPKGEQRLRPPRRDGARSRRPRQEFAAMNLTLALFLIVVGITLVITGWAARRTRTTVQFWAAGRGITGWQNGLAIAGDYMSAASFLGIAGLIAFNGYDGFMYSVGWLVAYLTVLFLIAEPMRNTGKYTMADVLAYRMSAGPVRSAAAISTLAVSGFYMIAQMVGAGSVLHLVVPSFPFSTAVAIVAILMLGYVVLGGMIATTWVQIVKATLLMAGAILLSLMVLSHFGFNPLRFFDA